MRLFLRHSIAVLSGFAFAASGLSVALATDRAGVSTIRTVSHSTDEPPAPVVAIEPQAEPTAIAAPGATGSASAAAPPTAAAPEHAKLPVARLPFRRSGPSATVLTRALAEPQVTTQTRQALGFYGGNPARATLNEFPHRTPIQPGQPQPMRRQIKPFQSIHRDPTVSPYMNLYREEHDTESAPNYFAFVRPQVDQIDANRMQQGEIQQLTRQLQSRSATVARPQYRPTGRPGASTPARYMDTAQFYGGWR